MNVSLSAQSICTRCGISADLTMLQNLLRTLTASKTPSAELKLLLSTVKETKLPGASHGDNKAADPFYDSLESVLNDLRTITMVSIVDLV